jgi:hypothetical protein
LCLKAYVWWRHAVIVRPLPVIARSPCDEAIQFFLRCPGLLRINGRAHARDPLARNDVENWWDPEVTIIPPRPIVPPPSSAIDVAGMV